jgi:hypothetical protein
MATKEAREAAAEKRKATEDMKKGRLQLLQMDHFSPRTKNKIKGTILADYGIVPSPPHRLKVLAKKRTIDEVAGTYAANDEEEVSELTLLINSSDEEEDEDLYG